ncbi:SH3-domain-containing protein [Fomitiporia mediterranea MF3/22]|uniref:SH3-domain-containing protein n=1 Tax=Fomitiporia mediterranea (strain MF3/22) TaxID=694068 RepID=UPI0004409A51|nr:SH3-domain-containing protein [Fomitiporia mediterranea MF3/22]EJD06664.1 SH3-domain-containing protein [Fomitiporia mediterranea MF3/22]
MSYVAHIVEQIQHNLSFLVENGHMSQQDADLVLSRLPSRAAAPAIVVTPTPAVRNVPVLPAWSARTVKARAVWSYNENGEDPNDLSFRAGDIIEIIEETNPDWWTGKINGKQGLLPSNHVEKLPADTFSAAPAAPARTILAPPPQYTQAPAVAPREKAAYRPFGAAHHGADKPPPPGSAQVNSVGLQEADGQDKKKSKYGKYGNTMAHSAAGGVGFGAGSAIGGGLVRAIF